MKGVKVSSVSGWKEVISDRGRFRVLFPREPTVVDSSGGPAGLHGFSLSEGGIQWKAVYNDFPDPTTDDPEQLRRAYRESAQVMAGRGGKLLRQEEVTLNGKLGTEMVIEGGGKLRFTRAFIVARRMYILEVVYKREAGGDSTLPKDVGQFFDSFTFWE
ncbi:MAG TPA: hypothetical protein VD861_05295 [Pyrinomonadaceae bacterium]|nr:hypothetical protein [Pyrinomonadaceae bacterium]